jgi:hypothetical protein
MKTIYKIYVPVTSQEQADRLKAICVKYGLPIWDDEYAFRFDKNEINVFEYSKFEKFFAVFFEWTFKESDTENVITESDFLKLAKEFKTQ